MTRRFIPPPEQYRAVRPGLRLRLKYLWVILSGKPLVDLTKYVQACVDVEEWNHREHVNRLHELDAEHEAQGKWAKRWLKRYRSGKASKKKLMTEIQQLAERWTLPSHEQTGMPPEWRELNL